MMTQKSPRLTPGGFLLRDVSRYYGGQYGTQSADHPQALPGSVLQTLTGTADPFNAGIYTYSGTTQLSANTTYWVVAGVTSGSAEYEWNFELPPNIEQGATIGSTFSIDQGASWIGQASPSLAFNMRVSGVPEPNSIILTATGIVLMAVRGLRMRSPPEGKDWSIARRKTHHGLASIRLAFA